MAVHQRKARIVCNKIHRNTSIWAHEHDVFHHAGCRFSVEVRPRTCGDVRASDAYRRCGLQRLSDTGARNERAALPSAGKISVNRPVVNLALAASDLAYFQIERALRRRMRCVRSKAGIIPIEGTWFLPHRFAARPAYWTMMPMQAFRPSSSVVPRIQTPGLFIVATASTRSAARGSSPARRGRRVSRCGLIQTCSRFRQRAEREGPGYQAAMNEALAAFAGEDHRPLSDVLRDIVRDELRCAALRAS